MVDRISILPDTILSHILSFLSTKEAVATSVLSKTWYPQWRSVSTLDFEDLNYSRFLHSVYRVILARDHNQPIHKFRLRFIARHDIDATDIYVWVNAAVQRRVHHLELSILYQFHLTRFINLSAIFTCRTLVILKLNGLFLKPCSFSSIDLPLVKVLHLECVPFAERGVFGQLLYGCPVLEDIKTKSIVFINQITDRKFGILPKLVRADISMYNTNFLLVEAVKNVEFLRIHEMEHMHHRHDGGGKDPFVFPEFPNLTHIELIYNCYVYDWSQAVGLLKHCPKLQVLVINQLHIGEGLEDKEELVRARKSFPYVRKCNLLCLQKVYLNDYRGGKGKAEQGEDQ
ncbi:F-box/LRR-repeat protein At4g14103-like isoform X2 [Lotus japonicus]|uniref:F-box/LRR-repeat protein At4g14103-like isoform X2 n=1 Tax=Lotus japonicus TaxID=34305 RepID=UPI00258F490D|nr:F-box/LRR-repeat protein At4g14103-like isoform X2 [Lotus japonicus]